MATANEQVLDRTIRRTIGIERYKRSEVVRILHILEEADRDLRRQLADRLELIRVRGEDAGPVRTQRFQELIDGITEARQKVIAAMRNANRDGMVELGKDEIDWQQVMIQQTIPVNVSVGMPTYGDVYAAAVSRPFQGAVLSDWWRGVAKNERDRLSRAVRLGIVEGRTTDEIVRDVFGTETQGFRDGQLFKTRRDAEAVVRTALNHVQNKAKEMFYDENSDIIQGLRWTATLDGRTTPLCRSRDGEIYDVDSGPRPPAHFNCRSIMVPVFDGDKIVGRRPSVTDTRTRREREIDFRELAKDRAGEERWSDMDVRQRNRAIGKVRKEWASENIGTVPAATTYQTWLSGQSASFQDEVLGPTRGKLFRQGGLTLDRFVDDRSGRLYSLRELRRREYDAFVSAGVENAA